MTDSLKHVRRIPSLPDRRHDAHKGNFGRVLIVGGSVGMAGAPALAGLAALRSGAGLVTIAVPAEIQPTVAALCPCATSIALPQTKTGQFDPAASLAEFSRRGWIESDEAGVARPDVVGLGPGLGLGNPKFARQVWQLIDALRQNAGLPVVLDADALNLAEDWQSAAHPRTIITPHPGELARMTATATADIQAERKDHAIRTARTMAQNTDRAAPGPVVVLKGFDTVVTDGSRVYVNDTGNPGMATGGSGDVLTGCIAALVGQGLDLFDAAVAGTFVHGLAGDIAATRQGVISLIASDIIDALPEAFQRQWPRRSFAADAPPRGEQTSADRYSS